MKLRKTTIILLALVAILQSSCANQSKNKNSALEAPLSAADSISDEESANASVFADLTGGEPSASGSSDSSSTGVAAASFDDITNNDDKLASAESESFNGVIESSSSGLAQTNNYKKAQAEFFYRPVGGERLGRVAYALYGDRKMVAELAAINPGLKLGSALNQEQAVYFEAEKLNPRSMLLTKDLIERYPDVLLASIEKGGQAKELTSVGKGETLQEVSQRLYGTTRYWTELYLLNRQKMSGFDRIPSGVEISYIKHDTIATLAAAPSQDNNSARPAVNSQMDSQNKVAVNTPIENTSTENAVPPAIDDAAPALVAPSTLESSSVGGMNEAKKVVESQIAGKDKPGFWTPANMRKAIYILLVALVIGLAAFMTRSGGRKNMDGVEEQRKVI